MGQNAILNITDIDRAGSFDLASYGKDVVTIGRSKSCDIVVNNPKVSHQHGKFYRQNGFWFYQDLNSTNGTIVNGKRINSVSLNTNDVMVFDTVPGSDSLRIDVKLVEGAFTPPPQPPINDTPPITVPPVDPPKKKGKIALIIALLLVLVAGIVVAILLLTKKSGVNSSPEKVAVNFMEGFAQRDTTKMKKSVHKKMQADYSDIADYEGSFNGKTIENIKAGTPINVASDDKKVYKAALKLSYDLDMEDVKIVRVTYDLSDGSTTSQKSADVICAEIDSSWYVIGIDY